MDDLLGKQEHNLSDISDLFKTTECDVNECCIAYRAAMAYAQKAWSDNLDTLMGQEKPASEMVDEAFENMRTYQCWLDYICRAVQFSGYGPPEAAFGTGLTSTQLGVVPGCQAPEDMGRLTTREAITNFLKDAWNTVKIIESQGETEVNMDLPDKFFTSNGMPFFPQCMTDITNKNTHPDMSETQTNYNACMGILQQAFSCGVTTKGIKDCTDQSSAFAQLETALRKNHGEQRGRVLEDKMRSIIIKMLAMESDVGYFKAKLQELDNRYACYPPKC